METTPSPAGDDPPVTEIERRWAARHLGLEENPGDLAAAALRYLEVEEFFLGELDDLAVRLLASPRTIGSNKEDLALRQSVSEDAWREQLRQFTHKFFSMSAQARFDEYRRLAEPCRHFPALRRHLLELKPAVLISTGNLATKLQQADPRVQDLAKRILKLFPRFPTEQATLSRELIHPILKQQDDWRTPARLLKKQFPEIAALAGDWFTELASGRAVLNRFVKRLDRHLPPPTWMKRGLFPADQGTTDAPLGWKKILYYSSLGASLFLITMIFIDPRPSPRRVNPAPLQPVNRDPNDLQRSWQDLMRKAKEREMERRIQTAPPQPVPGPHPRLQGSSPENAEGKLQEMLELIRSRNRNAKPPVPKTSAPETSVPPSPDASTQP